MSRSTPIIGVALDAAGRNPTARQLVDLALMAERANVDFVSLDDSFDPSGQAADRVHLDALLALAHVAAATTTIGLIATITTTHTEPFHVSKNIATLDHVSGGRSGWLVAVSTTAEAADRFGRRAPAPVEDLFAEADDAVEVVSRLWDSWEDDAVIRDRPTGRYVDRSKLHYVDFEGRFFDVRGPSITPRPPQGQPVVAVRANDSASVAFAARRADVVFVDGDDDVARERRAEIRTLATEHGRHPDDVSVLVVAPIADAALADKIGDWFTSGSVDGFVLQPPELPDGLARLIDDVLPRLADRGLLTGDHAGTTLRQRLGLARPVNRYARAGLPA